jgi:hypothetical protein
MRTASWVLVANAVVMLDTVTKLCLAGAIMRMPACLLLTSRLQPWLLS